MSRKEEADNVRFDDFTVLKTDCAVIARQGSNFVVKSRTLCLLSFETFD